MTVACKSTSHVGNYFCTDGSKRPSIVLTATMRIHSRFSVILFISLILLVKFSSSRCFKDEDCRQSPFERCCKRDFTCKTKRKCVGPCTADSDCPAGNQCVHNVCIITTRTTKLPSTESSVPCHSNQDCFNSTQMPRCCRGYCTSEYFCLLTPTPTVVRTEAIWCKSSRDCASGENCKGGKCKYRSDNIPSGRNAGFLSASIITGSVFLLILCCRFAQESSRQSFFRRRRRSRNWSRSRQRRQSSHHTTAEVNGGFVAESHLEPVRGFTIALPAYPRDLPTSGASNTSLRLGDCSPPPYSTLSFELPPSYDEVVQTRVNTNSVQTQVRSV